MAASAAARGMSVFSFFNYRLEWCGGMIYSGLDRLAETGA
jgi:hypothetical protein